MILDMLDTIRVQGLMVDSQMLRFWLEDDGSYDLSRLVKLAGISKNAYIEPCWASADGWVKFTHYKRLHAEGEMYRGLISLVVTLGNATHSNVVFRPDACCNSSTIYVWRLHR